METFIPQESIIGRSLNHIEKITVVESNEKGIMQHDIFSWNVLRDHMIKLDKNTQKSEDINKAVNEWLENTTPEQREVFADTLFEMLYSTEADSFGEISKSLSNNVLKILRTYGEITSEDKKNMMDTIKAFASSYVNVIKEKETVKFDARKEKLDEKYFKRLRKRKTKELPSSNDEQSNLDNNEA